MKMDTTTRSEIKAWALTLAQTLLLVAFVLLGFAIGFLAGLPAGAL